MADNKSLAATLPRIYNRDNVDQRRLGELLDLFNSARFTGQGASKARDLLGEVYEYFLEKFAKAEGKRGGEFYTPAGVVRVLVEVLEPHQRPRLRPVLRLGRHVRPGREVPRGPRHGGLGHLRLRPGAQRAHLADGQDEPRHPRPQRQPRLPLGRHLRPRPAPGADRHNGADFIMANPPFNIKDWARSESDPRWKYGVPPAGNANYAWIQHIISKLAPGGSAGVVMANGSMSSNSGGEGEIRAQLVEADLVSCMVALPTQLFRSTGIPVCTWFFAKDKTAGKNGSVDRTGQVLFIDARNLGYMVDRAERALSDEDIAKIANTYHAWRGTASAVEAGLTYDDEAGFCYSATPRGDQGGGLRADAGPVRRGGRRRGRRRADRGEDRAAVEGAVRAVRGVRAAGGVVREQLGRVS